MSYPTLLVEVGNEKKARGISVELHVIQEVDSGLAMLSWSIAFYVVVPHYINMFNSRGYSYCV